MYLFILWSAFESRIVTSFSYGSSYRTRRSSLSSVRRQPASPILFLPIQWLLLETSFRFSSLRIVMRYSQPYTVNYAPGRRYGPLVHCDVSQFQFAKNVFFTCSRTLPIVPEIGGSFLRICRFSLLLFANHCWDGLRWCFGPFHILYLFEMVWRRIIIYDVDMFEGDARRWIRGKFNVFNVEDLERGWVRCSDAFMPG